LKLQYAAALSNFGFNFKLRRYTKEFAVFGYARSKMTIEAGRALIACAD